MHSLRVLIAEDESLIALDLKDQLRRMGHDVVGDAPDGQRAVDLAEQLRPDLILMDIKMPKMDGIKAARKISSHFSVPIIFLTAYGEDRLARLASGAGGVAYLVKPVSEKNLVPAITVALRTFRQIHAPRRAGIEVHQESPVAFREIETEKLRVVTLGSFSVFRGRTEILASEWESGKSGGRKARSVFAYLISRRRSGVSRDEILEVFWPDVEYESAANCFKRTLHAIRRALQPCGPASCSGSHIFWHGGLCRLRSELLAVDEDDFLGHIKKAEVLRRKEDYAASETELEQAVSLYQGEWLSGLHRADDWCLSGRERLKVEYIRAKFLLADRAERCSEFARAVGHYQEVLAQDSYHEEAHLRLIRLLQRTGNHADALRLHESYAAKCRDLGVVPAPLNTEYRGYRRPIH